MQFNKARCSFKKEFAISSGRFDGNSNGEGCLRGTQTFPPERGAGGHEFGLHKHR